jgi:hypothetical protein
MNASQANQEQWIAVALAAALDNEIMNPEDVIAHATPAVLAAHLPPDVMTSVLASSLEASVMTAEVILRTAGPDVLSRHVPPQILWDAIRAAAERAGIST